MILLLMGLAPFAAFADGGKTDMTGRITNPSFETGTLTGWTTQGMVAHDNDPAGGHAWQKDGTWFCERWTAATKRLPATSLTQQVTLAPGVYDLTAVALATSIDYEDAGMGTTLFAGGSRRQVTTGGDYTVRFTVPVASKVTIGFGCVHTDAHWIAVDNFRLEQTTGVESWRAYAHELFTQAVRDSLLGIAHPFMADGRQWMVKAKATIDTAEGESLLALISGLETFINKVRRVQDLQKLVLRRRAELDSLLPADYPHRQDTLRAISRHLTAISRDGESGRESFDHLLTDMEQLRACVAPYGRLVKAVSRALTQLRATHYPGEQALQRQLHKAYAVKDNPTSADALSEATTGMQQALTAYLATRPSEWVTIRNGNVWTTAEGDTVQAHAPGFVRVGDIWYMCGEDRGNWWNPDVNLYSSTDLVHWKFEHKIVANGITSPELGSSRFIERPKLLYNATTDKFLVYCHWEQSDYGASEAGCFECDSVNGDYHTIWTGRPWGIKSRDCNVFQDTNGRAYFISTTDENTNLGLFELTDDYHWVAAHTSLFNGWRREAPAIVRVGDRYLMFNSACSGWAPNQCMMTHTRDLTTGWSWPENVGNDIAFDTQPAAILTIKGTKKTTYLYVGDRWYDPGLPETKTIIFPIEFNGTSCDFTYRERFDINFVTGEWRETPHDDYFVNRDEWKVIDCSSEELDAEHCPATNAIDGDPTTMWHTHYSGWTASAPHHLTIDMGREHAICGFVALPRGDGNTSGLIRNYSFETSLDGEHWQQVSSGDWLFYGAETAFAKTTCRYIRLNVTWGDVASLAELDVVRDPSEPTAIKTIRDVAADDASAKTVSQRLYYTLDGRLIDRPDKGFYIEKTIFADGSAMSRKRVR